MARSIDYANLSSDDLQYVSDRQWLIAEGDYQGFKTSETVTRWRETGEVPEPTQNDDGDEDGDIDYNDYGVKDLRAELKERGLETGGDKKALVARLEADDAEEADEDEDEEPEEDEIPEEEAPEEAPEA